MDMAYEHEIRERAYAIWLAAGMVDGDAERHWLHAEAALRDEAVATRPLRRRAASVAAAGPAKAKPAKATPAKAAAKAKADAATTRKPAATRLARPVAKSAGFGGGGLSAAAAPAANA